MRGLGKHAAIAALRLIHAAKNKRIRELPKLLLKRKRQRAVVDKPKQFEPPIAFPQDEATAQSNVSSRASSSRSDLDGWHAQCQSLARDALKSCGLSHDWCVEIYSADVDRALEAVHTIPKDIALRIADEVFDYRTPAEREQTALWNEQNGYCLHGITRDCCPFGCGSVPED